jgi:release factor glutamine methyltransferase
MLARAREFLERKRPESARLDAELLVAHALGLERLRLFVEFDRPVEPAEIECARALLVRRARGEPCAYLTGRKEFYGRSFAVGPGVLVPRAETELLVDLARERLAGRAGARIGELGTGSGCIAITLALELAGPHIVASDVSPAALAWALANARTHGVAIELVEEGGLAPLLARAPFDLIVSNPPYVDPDDAGLLASEVRDHEPALALFAPRGDPDHWLRALLDEHARLLAPGGTLLVELGYDQAPRARALCAERALAARLHRDLAGLERVLGIEGAP